METLSIPLKTTSYNTVGHTYVLMERVEGALAVADAVATLRFTVKEIDPSSGKAHYIYIFRSLALELSGLLRFV